MNLETYKQRRQAQAEAAPVYRVLCRECMQPRFSCYCHHVQKFDPHIKFMILIHPIEAKRRIATGRMAHQCLKNSELIVGQDYTDSPEVNRVLTDPQYFPVVLYPGRASLNLSELSQEKRLNLFPVDKIPVIFVIDGTWNTARKTMHLSRNLSCLTRISFTPTRGSQFRVRKQPAPECYSTIEAIHFTLELLGHRNEHNRLLYVFNRMVEKQLEFMGGNQRRYRTRSI